MAEFAMVVPVFLLVLLAIIEGGRFMFYYETLNHATREGARYAIVNGSNSLTCPTGTPAAGSYACDPPGANVVAHVRRSAFGVLSGTNLSVEPTWDPDNARHSEVTVKATYSYSPLVPLIPLPAITVQAESTLVINN